MNRRRTLFGLALAAVLAVLALPSAASAWPVCIPRAAPIEIGISDVSRARTGRVVTLELASAAMDGAQTVNVLLPRRYDPSGRTRYPVLYLLHGAGGDNRTYLDEYALADLVGKRRWIVVMPSGSGFDDSGQHRNGGYSDWFGIEQGQPGPAFAWESHHVRELVPFVDRTFPTRASAAGRAAAGISMGGGGAFRYAAQHPGLFGYVGSLSGELYPQLPEAQAFQPQNCKLGDPATEEVYWRDNDPTVLAANLRGVRLFVRSGDGTPGPHDSATVPADPIEAAIRSRRLLTEYGAGRMAQAFVDAAGDAGIPVDYELYPGSHSKPYWERELPEFVAWLDRELGDPVRARHSFEVKSAHRRFDAWGWTFRVRRAVREFLYVKVKHGKRLRLIGSGRVRLSSAPRFEPTRRYVVAGGGRRRIVVADSRGRLRINVKLGPSHTAQQTGFAAEPPPGWKRVRLRIRRA